MAFVRVKTIKGKQYRYRQHNVRRGKKVVSIMTYLGAVGTMAAVSVLAARDVAGKEKPRHYRNNKGSTDERANKHQVDYERELFQKDREKWHAHMREKLFKRGETAKPPQDDARAAEMRAFNERLKEARAEQEQSIATRKEAEPKPL